MASAELAGGQVRFGEVMSVVRVSGWSGPSLAIWASRTRSNRAIASGSLPADWYAAARLLSVLRVSGWSGPSLAIWASRTRSNRAIASGSLPAAWYATARLLSVYQGVGVVGAELGGSLASRTRSSRAIASGSLPAFCVRHREVAERGQGVGVVGAELGDLGVADALEQGDRLGSLPAAWYAMARLLSVIRVSGWSGPSLAIWASRTRSSRAIASGSLPAAWYAGEVVERGQGVGVVGAERAFEPLGGRLGHLQDLGVPSTAVVKNVREFALSLIGFGRPRIALPRRVEHGPPLRFGLFPGRQAVIGLRDRPAEGPSSSGWPANRVPTFSAARSRTSRSVTLSSTALFAGSAWVSRSWVRKSLIVWVLASAAIALSRLGSDGLRAALLGFRIPCPLGVDLGISFAIGPLAFSHPGGSPSHMPHDVPTIPATSVSKTGSPRSPGSCSA